MTDVKAYLQQVKLYDTHINNKLEELDRLRDMTTKITTTLTGDTGGSSGNMDKLGDAVARIVDLEAEINAEIDNYVDLKRAVSRTVDQVENPDELQVLRKRYFLYETWEKIACEMNYSYRNVCYIHGRALQTVDKILKGEKQWK